MKIYIAGPMSGYPEFNFPAFNEAEEYIRNYICGNPVIFNPAKKEIEKTLDEEAYANGDAERANEHGFNFREAYLWDVSKVIEADAIYMLKGWELSPGASGEHAVAVAMKRHYPEYQIIYG